LEPQSLKQYEKEDHFDMSEYYTLQTR